MSNVFYKNFVLVLLPKLMIHLKNNSVLLVVANPMGFARVGSNPIGRHCYI